MTAAAVSSPPPSRQDSQTSTITAFPNNQPQPGPVDADADAGGPTATTADIRPMPQQSNQVEVETEAAPAPAPAPAPVPRPPQPQLVQRSTSAATASTAMTESTSTSDSTPPSVIRVPTTTTNTATVGAVAAAAAAAAGQTTEDATPSGDNNINNNNNNVMASFTSTIASSSSDANGNTHADAVLQSRSQSQLSVGGSSGGSGGGYDEEIRDGVAPSTSFRSTASYLPPDKEEGEQESEEKDLGAFAIAEAAAAAAAAVSAGGVNDDDDDEEEEEDGQNSSIGGGGGASRTSKASTITMNSVSRQQLLATVNLQGPSVLTEPEVAFLQRLTVEGNDFEVECALEVLQDKDLFFEYVTPRHVKEQQQQSLWKNEFDDDATRDGAASTVAPPPPPLPATVAASRQQSSGSVGASSVLSSWSTVQPPPQEEESTPGAREGQGDNNDDQEKAKNEDGGEDTTMQPVSPPPASLKKPRPVVRVGSEKRCQILELRRQSGRDKLLWKAHENGIAVTTTASRASLKRRESIDSLNSLISRMSAMRLSQAASETIFRTRTAASSSSSSQQHAAAGGRTSDSTMTSTSGSIAGLKGPGRSSLSSSTSSSSPMKNAINSNFPPRPRRPYARSQSMSARTSSVRSSLTSSGSGNNFQMQREGGIPQIPEPARLGRRASTASMSRKSVTFHGIDEESEVDPKHLANIQVGSIGNALPRRSKVLKRSQSDSIRYESSSGLQQQQQTEDGSKKTDELDKSVELERSDSIPSLHHGHPIRQDSISSIPSLHHGHPIRQDSMSSIPSLHHGHLIRQDSVSSTPSLHHGHPIRQTSISSIPSLHHGHPIRADSVSSIPSLHHGHAIRSNSIGASSIPSLHHGHALMDDSTTTSIGSNARMIRHAVPLRSDASIGSVPSLHHGHPLQANQYWDEMSEDQRQSVTREMLMKQYAASDDIASAWLQQASTNRGQGNHHAGTDGNVQLLTGAALDRRAALPTDVMIPSPSGQTSTTDHMAGEDLTNDFGDLSMPDKDVAMHPHPAMDVMPELPSTPKPVLMRLASQNTYDGEGIEVTELDHAIIDDDYVGEFKNDSTNDTPIRSNIYIPDVSLYSVDASVRTVNSYDDDVLSILSGRRTSHIFRNIRRTLSDESMSNMYIGSGREVLFKSPFPVDPSDVSSFLALPPNPEPYNLMGDDTSATSVSWDMNSEMSASGRFDAWNVIQDEYANGYGGGGTLGFSILGTSADDESAQPHVLSPPLMESLQAFLPITKSGQNFYLKYSMIRDGASLHTLLKRARGVQYSILAVETIDGEVFGTFTGQPWRKNWNYFGTGESFLWKMRRSRLEKTHSILEQAAMESEIDVYPYTGENRFIQLCTHDRIAVGGGLPSTEDGDGEKKSDELNATASSSSMLSSPKDHEWGFGLAIQSDMLQGSSSPCVTFGSPSLSTKHSDGSQFEIINVELWTMTPCQTQEEAEKLDLGKLFLQRDSFNMHSSMQPC